MSIKHAMAITIDAPRIMKIMVFALMDIGRGRAGPGGDDPGREAAAAAAAAASLRLADAVPSGRS